jgi:quercetin dioxygenase-like cupin family protein
MDCGNAESNGTADDPGQVTFLGRQLGPSFRARVVTIAPGAAMPFVESEWQGALVVVEIGEVEMEGREGDRRRFETGDVLWLTGLGLRALHNPGDGAAVLVAVWRRGDADPGLR